MIEILRLTWSQDHASFHGEIYHFDDMTIDPKPAADTPIYYGGLTKAAVRRTVKYCEGWLPQRTPFRILDGMVDLLRKLEEEQGKQKRTAISYFPITSIDRDSSRARKRVGMERLIENLAHMIQEKGWKGISPTERDLEGAFVAGSPQECVDQLGRFQERGFDEIAFDLRNTFDEWESWLELLATEVLPHFKERDQ
jgi:alkanesulfonate monooxygenase SsuD/methylene tetrahydromethanopterin reductase-like flavin-dependent oxidoreductase (luciferase family)